MQFYKLPFMICLDVLPNTVAVVDIFIEAEEIPTCILNIFQSCLGTFKHHNLQTVP